MIHCTILQNLGFQTEIAVNGEEAVNAHSNGKIYDLILMDMDMPWSMDGIQVIIFKKQ